MPLVRKRAVKSDMQTLKAKQVPPPEAWREEPLWVAAEAGCPDPGVTTKQVQSRVWALGLGNWPSDSAL